MVPGMACILGFEEWRVIAISLGFTLPGEIAHVGRVDSSDVLGGDRHCAWLAEGSVRVDIRYCATSRRHQARPMQTWHAGIRSKAVARAARSQNTSRIARLARWHRGRPIQSVALRWACNYEPPAYVGWRRPVVFIACCEGQSFDRLSFHY